MFWLRMGMPFFAYFLVAFEVTYIIVTHGHYSADILTGFAVPIALRQFI
jgi:hypothetical protein